MEGAYFASKTDIFTWLLNDFNIVPKTIEECGTGAVYLQILNQLYPGKVPMHKAKLQVKQQWEAIQNFKLIQNVFQKCNIQKTIDINRLSKGLYQDNLELLQWLKYFCKKNSEEGKHSQRRLESGSRGKMQQVTNVSTTQSMASMTSRDDQISETSEPYNQKKTSSTVHKAGFGYSTPFKNDRHLKPDNALNTSSSKNAASVSEYKATNKQLLDQISELEKLIDSLNKEIKELQEEGVAVDEERRFYFRKLRKLELMSLEENRKSFEIQEVQDILFSYDDVDKVDEQEEENSTERDAPEEITPAETSAVPK